MKQIILDLFDVGNIVRIKKKFERIEKGEGRSSKEEKYKGSRWKFSAGSSIVGRRVKSAAFFHDSTTRDNPKSCSLSLSFPRKTFCLWSAATKSMSDQRSWGLLPRLNTKRASFSWICDFSKSCWFARCWAGDFYCEVTEESVTFIYTWNCRKNYYVESVKRARIESFFIVFKTQIWMLKDTWLVNEERGFIILWN